MNSWVNLSALWKIVVIGVLAGAGLPALFAIGLRAINTTPRGVTAAEAGDDERIVGGSVPGLVVAVLCFAVVLAAIGWGIYDIVNSS